MPIPVVETTAVSNQTSNATSKTDVTSPCGVANNDIVLIFVALDGNAGNPEANCDGFSLLTSVLQGAVEMHVLEKRSTGCEPANYTVNWTGNEQARFMTVRVSGVVTTGCVRDVLSGNVVNSGSTTNVISRLTSTVTDTLALHGVAVDRDRVDGADIICGTGWTEVGTSGSSGGANGAGLIVGENNMPSIEQVEAGTFGTWSSDQNASKGFNLKGAAGGCIVKNAPTFTVGITETDNRLGTWVRNPPVFTVGLNEASNRLGEQVRNAPTFTVALNEVTQAVLGLVKNAPTFTVGITEARNRLGSLVRNAPTFTVGITEARNRVGIWVRNIPSTVGITEARNRLGALVRNAPTFTVALNEASQKVLGLVKVATTFTVGLVEASQNILGLVKNAPTFTIGITEVRNRLGGLVRNSPTFTVGLVEARNRLGSLVRNAPTFTVAINEVRNRLGNLVRNAPTFTVALNEVNNFVLAAAGAALLKVIDDIVNVTEVKNKLQTLVRNVLRTVGITEVIQRIGGTLQVSADKGGGTVWWRKRKIGHYQTRISPFTHGKVVDLSNVSLYDIDERYSSQKITEPINLGSMTKNITSKINFLNPIASVVHEELSVISEYNTYTRSLINRPNIIKQNIIQYKFTHEVYKEVETDLNRTTSIESDIDIIKMIEELEDDSRE